MATFAAVMRIPFAGIMSFQPTTFIVMITGYVYGIQTGFFVGSIAALVSNMFLGQGPWTHGKCFVGVYVVYYRVCTDVTKMFLRQSTLLYCVVSVHMCTGIL